MQFEWDEDKNATNIQKHGIDFADVHVMFQSPMLVDIDDRMEYGEERWIGIGPLYLIIAVIVFTERGDDTIRIIRHERRPGMSDNDTNKPTHTNWERLQNQDDTEIDTSDIPELTDTFFERAKLVIPAQLRERTVQIDEDIVQWFKARDQDYPESINQILRSYIEAQNR